jgi:hypothetical protein
MWSIRRRSIIALCHTSGDGLASLTLHHTKTLLFSRPCLLTFSRSGGIKLHPSLVGTKAQKDGLQRQGMVAVLRRAIQRSYLIALRLALRSEIRGLKMEHQETSAACNILCR